MVDAMLVHPPAHSDASGHACHYLSFTENISQGLQDQHTEKNRYLIMRLRGEHARTCGRECSAGANLHAAAKRVARLDDGEAVRWLCQSAQRKLLRPGLFQIRHRPQPVRARKRHQAVPVNNAVRNSLGRRLGPEREAARQLLPVHAVHVHLPADDQPVWLKIFSL